MSAFATCFTTNTLLWYSEALRSIGAVTESRRLVEALVQSSKHPGVLAEAVDLRSGEQWGNTPCTSALLSLIRVGAVLKESNYKAGGTYLSEYKQLLIEKGKPWTHQLQRVFTQVTRALKRARGPTKKAAEVPEDLWMEKCRKEVNEKKAGQIHNPALMFAFATVWMLREVELAAIYKEDITIEEKDSIVALNLRITKGDQEGLGVWIDEDPDKVLHPANPNDMSESIIEGPEADVPQALAWKISGAKEEVRLVNEAQFEAMEESGVLVKGPECMVAFGGSYIPPQTEDDVTKMPIVNLNAGLEGQPGDKYRIRLYVQGGYKRLEWSKAKGTDAVAPLGEKRFKHKFSVIGDHSHWFFNDMQEVETGVYAAEVQILKSPSNFQIYRDRDFDQGFYPDEAQLLQ
eukprot:g18597.t1